MLDRQRRSSFVLLKSEDSSTSLSSTVTKPPSPQKKVSVTNIGNQSSTGSPSSSKPSSPKKKISVTSIGNQSLTGSPLSSKPTSPKKKISVTSIGTQSSTGSTEVLDQFYVNMPNGMVQVCKYMYVTMTDSLTEYGD